MSTLEKSFVTFTVAILGGVIFTFGGRAADALAGGQAAGLFAAAAVQTANSVVSICVIGAVWGWFRRS